MEKNIGIMNASYLILIGCGSSESNLPDSDFVFQVNSGTDSDAGINSKSRADSGVDSGANFWS